MTRVVQLIGLAIVTLCATAVDRAWAINDSIPYIGGDQSSILLGDGTGAIIGIVDSGVDDTHPALAGLDSLGNPRMVAEANFVTTEPGNTGDDVFGHGTWVASAALSSHATFTGMATDARYINARVLDSTNDFAGSTQVRNGIGFAINNGADILNVSLNFFTPTSDGTSSLDLMLDWAAFDLGINIATIAGNIAGGNGSTEVRSPGSAYNAVSVGRTTANFSRVHNDSATAFTIDGRMKPDVVAPGSNLTLANDDWEGAAADWDSGLNGTSFAAPHVAGLMAQMLEAGATYGLSTDPLVVKANIMNTADKVLDKSGNVWEPSQAVDMSGVFTVSEPLDTHSGAGQVNALALSEQYLAGEMSPGPVDPIGWDFNTITDDTSIDYVINPLLMSGSSLTATLTWYRHVGRTDDGDGIVDAGDSFNVLQAMSDLDLRLYRDGMLIAESVSTLDNVEHLFIDVDQNAQYTLRVSGVDVIGGPEAFALAWNSVGLYVSGDTDGDGDVDIDDLNNVKDLFGEAGPDSLGDADNDGDTDIDDLVAVKNNFGYTTPGLTFVPEPASVALLALGGVALLRSRRIRVR